MNTCEFRLRRGEPADAAAVAAASRLHVEYGLAPWWTRRRVCTVLEDPRSALLVAEVHGDFAGFALARRGSAGLHLLSFAVLPRYRRRTIGSALLDELAAHAARHGLASLRLEVRGGNRRARRFYHGHGFRTLAVRSLFYRSGEAAIVMARRAPESQPPA